MQAAKEQAFSVLGNINVGNIVERFSKMKRLRFALVPVTICTLALVAALHVQGQQSHEYIEGQVIIKVEGWVSKALVTLSTDCSKNA